MTRGFSRFAVVITALALVLAAPATAQALSLRQGQSVTIPRGEVVNDDIYAFGSSIQIDGTVNGDVIAAGQTVVVTGRVNGAVFAAGQSVRIGGDVRGSVRASGADVQVDGTVADDVLASAGKVEVASGGKVGRDAALAGGTVTIAGDVGRDAKVSASEVVVDGTVGGDLTVDAKTVSLGSSAKVGGDFTYPDSITPTVSGKVEGRTVLKPGKTSSSAAKTPLSLVLGALLAWVRGFVGWALFGLVALLVFPEFFDRASTRVAEKPWPSLGIGIAATFAVFALMGPVFVLGIFIGGWWIAFALLSVWVVLLLAGFVAVALWVGKLVTGRMRTAPARLVALLVGLLLVSLASAVPYVGWLVTLGVSSLGIGALCMLAFDAMRAQRAGVVDSNEAPSAP